MDPLRRSDFTPSIAIVPESEQRPEATGSSSKVGHRQERETSRLVSYESPRSCIDNGYALDNAHANPRAAGRPAEQAKQALLLMKFSGYAAANLAAPGSLDVMAKGELAALKPSPPLAGTPIEKVDYTSTLHHIDPEMAFEHLIAHPNEFFGAAGTAIHPPTARLEDGARVFLQLPGNTPPVWAPIEVRVNPQTREVQFNTLDGHPLRGTNRFSLTSDGQGGTKVSQESFFQLSSYAASAGSVAAGVASRVLPTIKDPLESQHATWMLAHTYLSDHAGR